MVSQEVTKKFNQLLLLQRSKGIIKWEDIVVGFKYHIPPIAGTSRKDIIVISKDNSSLKYQNIGKESYPVIMFRADVASKFLSRIK